ncbi:hypothetical protein GCM10011374_40140 [Kocuria dechangensis]|uniref:Bacteriophage T5 Orf172 DNA-binding domain-containing protein n=1 Tax=Kocuria dechangensis TaxID=1176249 RepID=A0A917H8Z4_9MICC|nr:DUF4041 domain-containing protein [Kocuria dechangensis]GGG71427.1 hypothetical protein GCM10011374_40140 [Kocuria dechangensis]
MPKSFQWVLWLTVLALFLGVVSGPGLLLVVPFLGWFAYKAYQDYQELAGAPVGGFGINPANAYRNPHVRIPEVPVQGLRVFAQEVVATNAQLLEDLHRVGAMDVLTRQQVARDAEAARLRISNEVRTLQADKQALEAQIVDVRAVAEVHSVGYYDFEHPAEASVKLAADLEGVRSRIKEAIRAKTAVRSVTGFTFNNSEKEGAKFVRDLTKLLLRAYNAEAENCVKTARAGNYHVAQNRLEKAREQIRKSGAMIGLDVTESFHVLRLREIELATLHLQAVAAAKEEERARREEAREAARALKELEAAKARQQKTVDHHLNVLAKLEETGDTEGAARVREQLAEAQAALADVDNRLANTRAGYVYVISNLGSFGERMVKIGMTRRLDPMDRVKELGDASVPFNFDVHALFFSQDAVDVEAMLHRHFAAQRVNRVNLRREYFYATPEDVRTALAEHDVEVVEFRTTADAEEFHLSEEIRATENAPVLESVGR